MYSLTPECTAEPLLPVVECADGGVVLEVGLWDLVLGVDGHAEQIRT